MNPSILLIYTGGTIGMKQDPATGHLVPFDFSQISGEVPEIDRFGYRIDTYSFDPVIDSSDARPEFWARIARTIESNYDSYDGFVVLHGTDTMSYSASALSYMLEGLEKSVIFTGSQLPIGVLRTDGRENLISAIEMNRRFTGGGSFRVVGYFENIFRSLFQIGGGLLLTISFFRSAGISHLSKSSLIFSEAAVRLSSDFLSNAFSSFSIFE